MNEINQDEDFECTDIVLDLETMGTASDAAILSIGAVQVDRVRGKIAGAFYAVMCPDEALGAGGTVSGSTFLWWLEQSTEARMALVSAPKAPLLQTLVQLADWMGVDEDGKPSQVKVWGNGDTFDNVILDNTFKRCGIRTPWEFWNNRDLRTAMDLQGIRKSAVPFEGAQHNALYDAQHQAKLLLKCLGVGDVTLQLGDDYVVE